MLILSILLLECFGLMAQPPENREIRIIVLSSDKTVLPRASVMLLKEDASPVGTVIADTAGAAVFSYLRAGKYLCRVTMTDHRMQETRIIDLLDHSLFSTTVTLERVSGLLSDVTVTARKPLVQFLPDKTVINVEAGITNAGSSVMEVLEKSPGVTMDKEGNISLKGRPGVQVMIDGKPTQLSGNDLQNLLAGMSASEIEFIELIDNPSARYDAAGNAGIINIKTKKNKQKGFNGSVNIAYGQGRYPKNNNSLVFNFRTGSFNFFLTYGVSLSRYYLDMYALRTYFKDDGISIAALLEQPYFTRGKGYTHNLRVGADYYLNSKTTLGFAFNGLYLSRDNTGNSTADWKNAQGVTDSTIYTNSINDALIKQGGINLNARHVFSATSELTADVDMVRFNINNGQLFENRAGSSPSVIPDATKGDIPSTLEILSAKVDYSKHFGKVLWEAGGKSSRVNTDNFAKYYFRQGNDWQDDLGKSNHFLYTENIHALYTNFDTKVGKWGMQGGLRYEYTTYDASQLGNAVSKDSSFNRNYFSFFPTAFFTYQADSSNSFTLRAGRRIDRPAFQKLNPFTFIINKYTYQEGNPFIHPQYTWNIELSHLFKEVLSTTASYSIINDYFSQVFLSDSSTGKIIYTEGNVGNMQYFALSSSVQVSPVRWWSLSGQATLTHKKIEGTLWKDYRASITQLNLSMNNQFRLGKGWGAELSGFYITKNQNDLQEVLEPTGQASMGLSKQILKNKGTLRFSFRDMFYTQAMEGLTHFESVIEYFKLQRDTRVATVSFIYRFGKTMKLPAKRQTGSAAEEMDRAGGTN